MRPDSQPSNKSSSPDTGCPRPSQRAGSHPAPPPRRRPGSALGAAGLEHRDTVLLQHRSHRLRVDVLVGQVHAVAPQLVLVVLLVPEHHRASSAP